MTIQGLSTLLLICAGSVQPFAEHLLYALIFSIPLSGTWALGGMSLSVLYAYPLFMDIVNIVGHCNVEFFPERLFQALPVLKYLMYTPT
jgi:aldehyde decarbonylase